MQVNPGNNVEMHLKPFTEGAFLILSLDILAGYGQNIMVPGFSIVLLWLRYCQFGPLEWIWRMLTYGKWLKLFK